MYGTSNAIIPQVQLEKQNDAVIHSRAGIF
jgi:hypothetical protein